MTVYKVRITEQALQDMEQIYAYIAVELQAPMAAMGQYNRIADAILTLSGEPERFRLLESEPEHSRDLRRMNVDHYAVFFVIRKSEVIVTDVLYGATDIEEKLRDRRMQ